MLGGEMRIGIDLGGTKIAGAVLSADGSIVERQRTPTPDNYADILRVLTDMVASLESKSGTTCSVGIGVPGAKSPHTGLMKNASNAGLNGHAFDDDLAAALERPIRMANDADCFALSEAVDGAGAGHDIVFGVIIGTGTGGGVVVGQKLLQGVNAIAGEWGHNPLPWPDASELPGPACYCGRHGCIERYLSGTGLQDDHAAVNGEQLAGSEIIARAQRGDAASDATLDRYVVRMARSLASLIVLLDPGVVVLGGGVSNIDALYERVPARWGEYIYSDHVATKLARNVHGDDSGVRGAAWLWDSSGIGKMRHHD
jgi:fructokinase